MESQWKNPGASVLMLPGVALRRVESTGQASRKSSEMSSRFFPLPLDC